MKAIRIHGRGGPEHLVYEDAPQPQPGPDEVLVRVAATAVIVNELTWDLTYQNAEGVPRPLPIPGHDFSGVVAEVGANVRGVAVGDAVYGLIAFGRDGAEAEYALALPGEMASKPRTLDDAQAATVPLAALTAWQALFAHGRLTHGQTVLIHGAAGGVGSYAVQFAHWAGARVIATAASQHSDFLRELGADEVIDYASARFEDLVHDADLVVDTVGGETLARSWQAVRDGGALVSVVSPPPPEPQRSETVRFVWFIVEPDSEDLRQIGALLDAGQIRPIITQVFPLAEARRAFEEGLKGHARGKIVITIG